MNLAKATKILLDKARAGEFGTPEAPDRSGSEKRNFWMVYFGHRKASEYKGTVSYPSAKAGELYRREQA